MAAGLPVHTAAEKGHLEVVKLILAIGGTELSQAKTSCGKTSLMLSRGRELRDLLFRVIIMLYFYEESCIRSHRDIDFHFTCDRPHSQI